ncbi:Rho guanine nucleotide exchange factor 37, partial [Dissostichus eleginoides]
DDEHLLLSELPQFNSLALQLIWSLLGSFSCVQKDLASDMETLFLSFAQQLPKSSLSPSAFWEWAEAAVLDEARKLETLCQSVEETLNAPSSQQRLQQLTERHGSEKIFQVSVCVVGGRDLDLSLARGELVGVISWADTRGDKRRWLVDAGEAPPPSPHLTLPDGGAIRRHSYTPESQRLTVLAAYDFTARGNHEVSMRAGEVVRVLEAKDKRGNPEWSLVEAGGGKRGYVPSNYLTMMPIGGSAGSQPPF